MWCQLESFGDRKRGQLLGGTTRREDDKGNYINTTHVGGGNDNDYIMSKLIDN